MRISCSVHKIGFLGLMEIAKSWKTCSEICFMYVTLYFLHEVQILLESYLEVHLAHLKWHPSDTTKLRLWAWGGMWFPLGRGTLCSLLLSSEVRSALQQAYFSQKDLSDFFLGSGNQPHDLWQMILLLSCLDCFSAFRLTVRALSTEYCLTWCR